MKLSIDSQIFDNYKDLQCGIVVAKTVNNERKTFALDQIFNGLSAQTAGKFKKSQLDSMPRISNWQNVYNDISGKTFKTNLERLLRDVLAGHSVPFDDNLSRIRDYFMLKWRLPIICLSLNDIYGDVQLIHEGKDIVYKDKGSVLTKKWNSQQYERGSVIRETTSVVFIVEDLGVMDEAELKESLAELGSMLQKYCFGAEIEVNLINKENPEVELGVEGMTEFIEQGEQSEPLSEEVEEEPEKIPEVEEIKEQTAADA
jgi:DNA/RNA-binding domain of Phe-tRNA-synthetase-like protein